MEPLIFEGDDDFSIFFPTTIQAPTSSHLRELLILIGQRLSRFFMLRNVRHFFRCWFWSHLSNLPRYTKQITCRKFLGWFGPDPAFRETIEVGGLNKSSSSRRGVEVSFVPRSQHWGGEWSFKSLETLERYWARSWMNYILNESDILILWEFLESGGSSQSSSWIIKVMDDPKYGNNHHCHGDNWGS